MRRTPTFILAGLAGLMMQVWTAPAGGQPPPGPADKQSIVMVVHVPASAVVEVEGVRTKLTGETRNFYSPPLPPGKSYTYALKASWSEGGRQIVRTREVTANPGQTVDVDFRQEPNVAVVPKVAPKVASAKTPEIIQKTDRPKTKEASRILVPYVPTAPEVVDKMLELAEVKKDDVVYDLGCGDGVIVITAAKKFGARGVGVDLDPQRVKEAQENVKKNNVEGQVEIRQGDLLQTNVKNASVVALYLLPEVNLMLRPNLLSQLKPGSRIVSHDFDMGDWKPTKKIDMLDRDGVEHSLFLWIVEAPKK